MDSHIDVLIRNYPLLEGIKDSIIEAFNLIKLSFENDKTLFLCGNGGSAADCEHIAGELLKGFLLPRKIKNNNFKVSISERFDDSLDICNKLQDGLRTVSLTSHPGFLTAFLNDVDPDMMYAQQLFNLARKDDVLLGITTSGNSKNIYKAFQVAYGLGVKTVLLTGKSGGRCSEIADVSIKVPLTETYRIQEYHLPIYHSLCIMLEEYFYGS